MNGTILIKKITNADELASVAETLYNYVSEIDPDAAEQGMANFCSAIFPDTALDSLVTRKLAEIADEADASGDWRTRDQAVEALRQNKRFPLYIAIAGRSQKSGQDLSDWWQWGINVYTENEIAVGNDPSWDFNDFIEEMVM